MSAMGEELLGVTALETYTGRAEAVIPLEQPVLDPC
jgi:hypothetical protein